MIEELKRSGDDTRGSMGLRLPRPVDQEAPPIPVPALLADCGVFSRLWTARLNPDFLLLWVAADKADGDRPGKASSWSFSVVVLET